MNKGFLILKNVQKVEDVSKNRLNNLSKENDFLQKISDLNSEENKLNEKMDIYNYLNENNEKEEKFIGKKGEEISINEVQLNKIINNINNNKGSEKKIFEINKVIKLGRAKKLSQRKRLHNKYAKDNVIRRVKVQLINNIYEYINSLFNINNYGKSKKPINIIKKVNPVIIKSISKVDNMIWLDSTIEFFFSQDISIKLTNFEKDYNKKLIQRILAKNEEKKVIPILKKRINEMLYAYATDDEEKNFPGFKTIKDDIKKFKEFGEEDKYIELYTMIASNFKKLFDMIIPRKKNNKLIN